MKKLMMFCTAAAGMIMMAACGNGSKMGGSNNEADLYKTWRLVEVNGETIDTTGLRGPLDFEFNKDEQRFSGTAGCNRITGKFTLAAPNKLTFSPLAATKMMCPNIQVEDKFLSATTNVDSWEISSGFLVLKNGDQPLIRFKAN